VIRIKYLRHGNVVTGGTHFERNFCADLVKKFNQIEVVDFNELSNEHLFKGLSNIKLLLWGYVNSDADLNIVVGRIGLSSILKNLFNKNKTLVVLHNFDENDEKGVFLKVYFQLLFYCVRLFNSNKIGIICVSEYFKNYFEINCKFKNVFIYPNSFDASYYSKFINDSRGTSNKVWMGQLSTKYDNRRFELADKLISAGYIPIFSKLKNQDLPANFKYKYFQGPFEQYLTELASCYCSLSLSKFVEGWPRMVHESTLVGTPVIGYPKGGLTQLLTSSNSFIVDNIDEALNLILNDKRLKKYSAPDNFVNEYENKHIIDTYLTPIIQFIKENNA